MINILSIILLNKFCFSSNISYAVLNYTYTNVSALLNEFGEPKSDSGEIMSMLNEYEHVINNRPTTKIVKKWSPSEGPFYNLVVNICKTILYKFKSHKVPKYIKALGESLKGLGHDYLKRLVRHVSKQLKHLSKYSGTFIKKKVKYFLKLVQDEKPRRVEFFKSMNALFSIYWDTKMDEYIWLLEDFGRGRKRTIDHETKRLCSAVVIDRLYKQRRKKTDGIVNKLMLAYREYLIDRVRVIYDIGDVDKI